MRVTLITDRNGMILGMAHNQLIVGDKRYVNAVEIRASPAAAADSPSRSVSRRADKAEEFESHTLNIPDHLVGKGIEELRELAHIDLSGEQPTLRLRAKAKTT